MSESLAIEHNPFEIGLDKGPANFAPLTPLTFLPRSAAVYPEKTAVIHGDRSYTYAQFYARCRRLASALARRGVGRGDTVAVLAPNVPAVLEAHFGVPIAGAVLSTLNTRLDARTIAYILDHAEAQVLISDRELNPVVKEALARTKARPTIIDIDDPLYTGDAEGNRGELLGETDYEGLLAEGDAEFEWAWPANEWQAITLNYTSGTTGDPKGVVYPHRGTYINAVGQILGHGLGFDTVYLWTLPMFHCNGWCYTWGLTAVAGTHVCLRKVDPALVFPMIESHGVTHMCGAPVVLGMLINAPEELKRRFNHVIKIATGGSSPPKQVIAAMEAMGFEVMHLYGMTEVLGPSHFCAWHAEWSDLPLDERAAKAARQGVRYPTLEQVTVADPETLAPVPADGETIGEVMMSGNTVMKGYLKNAEATAEAFHGGWFHSGDLAVLHPDGYMEIKDRKKDIIISGGENISSVEVEKVLYEHPSVMEAAVVAKPHEKWGEVPCAFVDLKPGADPLAEDELIRFCRDRIAGFKTPKRIVFGPLPKTATGKIQKYTLRERAREA